MQLLAASPGALDTGAQPVDPRQTPADLVVLSAPATPPALLSTARPRARSAARPLRGPRPPAPRRRPRPRARPALRRPRRPGPRGARAAPLGPPAPRPPPL